jgi:HEXXH motif-containing protein
MVTYAALSHNLKDIDLDRESSSQFQESYRVARLLEPSSLAMVFRHPSMQYWTKTTQRLIPYLRSKKRIPEALTEHLGGVPMRGDDVARMHLMDINRFIIAAAIVAKEDVSLPCPVHDGWISLPGIGISIASPGDSVVQVCTKNTPVPAVRCGNSGPIRLPRGLEVKDDVETLQASKGVRAVKRVQGSQGAMFLDTVDPYFKSVWLTQAFPGNVRVGVILKKFLDIK